MARPGAFDVNYRFERTSSGEWVALTQKNHAYCDPMEDLGALLTIMALDDYNTFY